MASSISAIAGAAAQTSTQQAANAAVNGTPSKEMFLQLLVTQIKNQDPLNPTDSTQFVSQLAQFSELEQVIAIRQDIEAAGANSTTGSGTTQSTTQI